MKSLNGMHKYFQKSNYRVEKENCFPVIIRRVSTAHFIFPQVYEDVDTLSSLWKAIEFWIDNWGSFPELWNSCMTNKKLTTALNVYNSGKSFHSKNLFFV